MKKPSAFWVIIVGIAMNAGCATSPRPPISIAPLEGARRSLAQVNLSNEKIAKRTAQIVESDPNLRAEQDTAETALNIAFNDMLQACRGVLTGLESRANKLQITKVVIGIVGALVGGVFIPVLTTASAAGNAALIAGLGGVSGAANAAQMFMSEAGLTPTVVLQARQKILEEWKSATNDYFDPKSTYEVRVRAIHRGLTACTLYAITVPE